jgi:hypothetical protein
MFAVVRIISTNDRNGNPRRGWLIRSTENENSFFIREDFDGDAGLRKFLNGERYMMVGHINVQPSEFKRLERDYCTF